MGARSSCRNVKSRPLDGSSSFRIRRETWCVPSKLLPDTATSPVPSLNCHSRSAQQVVNTFRGLFLARIPMKTNRLTILAMVLLAAAPGFAKDDASHSDLEKLSGTWL